MTVQLISEDSLVALGKLPAQSVQCVVTSPPYYGLRDYGTAKWEGGSPDCDHKGKPMATHAGFNERYFGKPSVVDEQGECLEFYKDVCGKCGAIRIDGQIGLEQTPDEYVNKLVAVFREVRRVLKDDGTLWLNLGDSYAHSLRQAGEEHAGELSRKSKGVIKNGYKPLQGGYKEKDLIGIPWMVAFALRADGWYLRQDIIWAKPNPMPESVKDRCTKSHEYIFLLTKNGRYYYDNEAVMEKGVMQSSGSPQRDTQETHGLGGGNSGINDAKARMKLELQENGYVMRNKRDVWTVTTKPYKDAHFATFPPDLIEPCILAGSKEGDTILDPFNGAGTTGLVAIKHNRHYIGIDLNASYIEMSKKRLKII